jgi:hypothetical protein
MGTRISATSSYRLASAPAGKLDTDRVVRPSPHRAAEEPLAEPMRSTEDTGTSAQTVPGPARGVNREGNRRHGALDTL